MTRVWEMWCGALRLCEAQTVRRRSPATRTKTDCCVSHCLTPFFLFPVPFHRLVLRAQDARDGLNPQTPENGGFTDVILRDATKCTQKVLTWRLIGGHIQVQSAGLLAGGSGRVQKGSRSPPEPQGARWCHRTHFLSSVPFPPSADKGLSLSEL